MSTYLLPGGAGQPVYLYPKGNQDLLNRPAVAIVGSRKASLKGIDAARDCAAQLALNGITVVSGYAQGVDITSHRAALEAGGTTIAVLPEGLDHWRLKREIEACWDWGRALAVSQFEPDARWSKDHALARNGVICRLASAVIVAEAGVISGTMNTVRQCLKQKRPLFAVSYVNMEDFAQGNAEAIRMGAQPLFKNRMSQRANLEAVLDIALSAAVSAGKP